MTSDPKCVVCDRTEANHSESIHPFTLTISSTEWLNQKKVNEPPATAGPPPEMSSFPFDPVLRIALINKGVLTTEDLAAAEAQIKAIGGVLNSGH